MSVQDLPASTLTREEVARLIAPSGFHKLFGIDVVEVTTEPEGPRLTLSVVLTEHLERQPETHQWHGGAISAAVDITGCYTLGLLTGGPPPTVNFRTDYLRPAMTASLTLTGQVRRAVRWEAVVVSLLGAVVGILAGLAAGIGLQQALVGAGIDVAKIRGEQLLLQLL